MAINIPEISVLMSIYNEPIEWLILSVDSILNQTYENFEFIIINDNPERKDNILFLENLKLRDRRVVSIYNSENIGLAKSLNKGLKIAKGRYIARMDADDIAVHNRLANELEVISALNCDLVCGKYSIIDETGRTIKDNAGINGPYYIDINKLIHIKPSIIHHPTVMFNKLSVSRIGGYRSFPCAQDADLWMRLAEKGCSFIYIPNTLVKYRINNSSVSKKNHFKQQLTYHYIYQLSIERLKTGKDSFSETNYKNYITRYGYGDKNKELDFEKSFSLLRQTHNKKIIKIVNKLIVFIKCASLRKYYINKLYKCILNK